MRRASWALLLLVVAAVLVVGLRHETSTESPSAAQACGLPREACPTLALVRAGGPFPYARDGVVFENREGRLPQRSRGYWHEYTVPTPGESDRGARRIVVGRQGEVYYTRDHYGSFVRGEEDVR